MTRTTKAKLQALINAALEPLRKQLGEQAARLEKLDSIPAGAEPLRKAEIKPWRPIKPLRKLNGTHILPEAAE